MLDEYKQIYATAADRIPNWKKLNKNELCFKYIENENNAALAESYLGAIVCRYWGLIGKYHSMSYNVADVEDVYEWLIDSIIYTLKHRRWQDPDSKIYNDPTGPDKMINRCIKSRRLTYYQKINRQKRKDSFNEISLDKITEDLEDNTYILQDDNNLDIALELDSDLDLFIKQLFLKKDYFTCYLLYFIAYENIFVLSKDSYDMNACRVGKCLRALNEDFADTFSKRYKLNKDKVLKSYKYIHNLSYGKIHDKVLDILDRLKHDKFLYSLLRK